MTSREICVLAHGAATKPANAFTLVPGQGSQIVARHASFRSSVTAPYIRRVLEDRHGGEYCRAGTAGGDGKIYRWSK